VRGSLQWPDWGPSVERQERIMTRQFDVVVEKDSDGFFVAKDYGIGRSKYSAAAG
jgi:hypothetical protein